ncbi:MAG: hypothetical protein L0Y79_09065 [Chlorobi bacterium]|nr:hypothetical protein [Chlorobiota bacterium]MCI0716954.1 hypothetical protein [Chlorobiota bacterium]
MKARNLFIVLIIGLVLIGVSGCSLLKKRVEKTERIEYKLNANGKFRLEIDNTNGEVTVMPVNDTLGFIYVSAEKIGKVKQDDYDMPIEGITINIDTTDEIIKIETELKRSYGLFKKSYGGRVNYKIRIPAHITLLAETVNGPVRAQDLTSDIRLETVNGSITVDNCYGTADLTTVNGKIKGNFDSTKGIIAETVNGSITLGSLKNVSADVNASVVNGRVKYKNLSFNGLTLEKKNLNGILGSGTVPIRLSTVNGSIKLDGNPINIAKEDWEFEFKIDFDDDDEHIKFKDMNSYDVTKSKDRDLKDTSNAKGFDSSRAK